MSKKIKDEKRWLFIGRYQPLHPGHCKLIRTVLNEGRKVLVALRITGIDESNPYSVNQRRKMFEKEFATEVENETLRVIAIPDVEGICYGRKVGWQIRQIKLDDETEAISATKIRKQDEIKKNKN